MNDQSKREETEGSVKAREWTLRIHSNNDGGGYLYSGDDVKYPEDDYLEVVEKKAYEAIEKDRDFWHKACAKECNEKDALADANSIMQSAWQTDLARLEIAREALEKIIIPRGSNSDPDVSHQTKIRIAKEALKEIDGGG